MHHASFFEFFKKNCRYILLKWKSFGRPVKCLILLFLIILLLYPAAWFFVPKPKLLDEVSFSVAILDRKGKLLRLSLSDDHKYRLKIKKEDLPAELVEATLLYEDKYFWRHPGINPAALIRAFIATYVKDLRRMGGSTITMQLARLRFKMDTTNWSGKILQILRSLQLELHYSKEEILEAYFNLAPYGGNVEGAGAAAVIYYHKPLMRLSLPEILSLVGVPQNPNIRNPAAVHNEEFIDARQRVGNLWRENHPEIGQIELLDGLALKVNKLSDLPFVAPHLTTELLHGKSLEETSIETTLDSDKQKLIESIIKRFAARGHMYGVDNAAALLLYWPDMEIRALIGSADFHNEKIEGQIDGTMARRSPGSTLKPFIYALALDQGLIHPQTVLIDSPKSFSGYDPENADLSFKGPLPAKDALALSRNIPAIVLAQQLRNPDLYAFMQQAGIVFPHSSEYYGLALVLGGAEVCMRDLASLYGMLANRGVWQPLQALKSHNVDIPPRRLLSPEAAFVTMTMLRSREYSGHIASVIKESRVTTYVKTGTSNGFRDAWAVGIAGPYVLAVWVGNFNNKPNPAFVGSRAAVPLWTDIMNAIAATDTLKDLTFRDMAFMNVSLIEVCKATGDLDTSLCREKTNAWFIPGVSPIKSTGVFRPILIDKKSGLRACVADPENTERVIWEFWPSHLQKVFHQAGIIKPPPPPFLPACTEQREAYQGQSPLITIPKAGVIYNLSMSRKSGNIIPLSASADADVLSLFWFAGNRFLGRSKPDQSLMWEPAPGVTEILVMDKYGRTASRKVKVESVQ